ncbi:MAG: CapA family protein [bacterium]
MKSYKDKQLLFGLLFLGLSAGFLGRGFEHIHFTFPATNDLNQAAAVIATQQNLVPSLPTPTSITIGMVGDIMLDRGVKFKVNKNLGGDYAKLFANASFLKDTDITFANLEGPVSDVGADRHNLYSFRMDPKIVPVLKDAGVDVVSSANNHIKDWGEPALIDTLERLRAGGIQTCGIGMNKAEAETPAIFTKGDRTVGFLCFTDVGPDDGAATDTKAGVLLANDPDFDTIVHTASTKVDALIVSFHFGVEYQTKHNARQEALAQKAIDDGAVMIVGAHPHVAEDIAAYNGAPILYSLGNFIFDQPFSSNTTHGLYVTATLTGKSVTDVTPHETVLDSNYAPSLSLK